MSKKKPSYRGVLIIGASSGIGSGLARLFAAHTEKLFLSSRFIKSLLPLKQELETTAEQPFAVESLTLEARDYASHSILLKDILRQVDLVICAIGDPGDEKKAKQDFSYFQEITAVNYLGIVSILKLVEEAFIHNKVKSSSIVVISSVSALRGRKTHAAYGSAKAALHTYLSALRQRLYPYGAHVMTVLPGLVRTKMTAHRKQYPLLSVNSEQAAWQIYRACLKKKDVIYVSRIWRVLMFILDYVPERIFKRMRF